MQLTLVVEWPNQVDIAALWVGIGDPGQVVYFNRMFISSAIKPSQEQDQPTTRTCRRAIHSSATHTP